MRKVYKSAHWVSKNEIGRKVSDDIYFYTINAGGNLILLAGCLIIKIKEPLS